VEPVKNGRPGCLLQLVLPDGKTLVGWKTGNPGPGN